MRRSVERETLHIWRTSPVYGVGLKYFATGQYPPTVVPPTNIVDNELAESGVIGLVGFVGLQVLVLLAGVRRRRDDPLIVAGVGVRAGAAAARPGRHLLDRRLGGAAVPAARARPRRGVAAAPATGRETATEPAPAVAVG